MLPIRLTIFAALLINLPYGNAAFTRRLNTDRANNAPTISEVPTMRSAIGIAAVAADFAAGFAAAASATPQVTKAQPPN